MKINHIIYDRNNRFNSEAEAAASAPDGIVAKSNFACDPWVVGRLPVVGDYLNHLAYSDVNPYKIVAMSPSGKTATVRAVSAERDTSVKLNFIPGGFAAHCPNQRDQKWHFGELIGPERKVRLCKDGWKEGSSNYSPADHPIKFYDYNF